jgi:hypothetical protein
MGNLDTGEKDMKKIFWLLALVAILIFGCVRIVRADCLDKKLAYEDAHRNYKEILQKLEPKINAGKKLTEKENEQLIKAVQTRYMKKRFYINCLRGQRVRKY